MLLLILNDDGLTARVKKLEESDVQAMEDGRIDIARVTVLDMSCLLREGDAAVADEVIEIGG